ncbi:methionyl-tRNA formyltransferase [Cohaesibacter celericrescens]|uniref:Methionyl-tRNA formyltransferase n=1 Tax=Cohaesibacter celericrescens TaxID=2067669 RepID=A0A2N5XNF8_9HYPH|nr:methionyl-tRNA formyltransferase [Cohaesibacter celericrescens]PLW76015.1 methionyl-tRNA formyltransferase [Cohaesibacter celericrescens]
MRVVFMGTPDFSVPTLMEIVGQGHEVVAVYSQPPRPAGRGMEERKSPVHQAAEKLGLPVFTPSSLKSEEEQEKFRALDVDVAVVVAYGLLLPKAILDAPRDGCLNLHGSKLPRWRGAAPIQRAIMAGDAETAVQVMRMDVGLDTGDVCMSETIAIGQAMTAQDLHDHMMVLGADLMGRALAALSREALGSKPQLEDGVTYAKKIDKTESRIDFSKPAAEVHNIIRGLSPFPGAWVEMTIRGKPLRVKLLRSELVDGTGAPGTLLDGAMTVACGDGAVRLIELQRAGKGAMKADVFQRGADLKVGEVIA